MTKQWAVIFAVLGGCAFVNMGKVIFNNVHINGHLGHVGNYIFPIKHYVTLNYQAVLTRPFNDWGNDQSFLDVMLKKSVFGEYHWTSPHLASAMLFLLMIIVFYSFLPYFMSTRKEWRGMLPYGLDIIISFMMLFWFHVRHGSSSSQDFRYIYPTLICFVIFFGKSQQFYQQRNMLVLTWLGPVAVALFSLLSVYFFWMNWR
jgi:hypothetical protein